MSRRSLPHAAVALAALATLAAAPRSNVVNGEAGARLDAAAREAEQQGFHGVVLAARGGEELLVSGYGLANRAAGRRFDASTVVQIGSNVKDFTKVAVLQLVEQGRVRLTDTLSTFFPQAPPDKRAITLEQLLEHTGGFPLGVGPDEEVLAKEAFLDRVFARPLAAVPGGKRIYSNAGYSLLAIAVEQVTSRPYETHVAAAIFAPAGMRETGLLLPRFDPSRLAHGYSAGEDRGTMLDRERLADGHGYNLRGNGGHVSTVRDMFRFYRALRDGTLLREPAHRARVVPEEPVMLAGSDGTCFFLYAREPREDVELLIATNHAGWKAPRLLSLLRPVLVLAAPSGQPASAKESDQGLEIVARGANGGTARLTFLVEPEPPFRFRGLGIEVGP